VGFPTTVDYVKISAWAFDPDFAKGRQMTSTISTTIPHSIYYGAGRTYTSPLTITNTGSIDPTTAGAESYAVIGFGGGQLFNQGIITGVNAGLGGVELTNSNDYLNNSGTITGVFNAVTAGSGNVINSGDMTVTTYGVLAGSYAVRLSAGTFTNTSSGYVNEGVSVNILNGGNAQDAEVINRGTIVNNGNGDGVGLNSDFGFYGSTVAGSGTVIDSGTISESNSVGWAVYFGGATALLDLESGYKLIGHTAMAYAEKTATSAIVELSNYNGDAVTVNFSPTSFTNFHTVEFDSASEDDGTLGLATAADKPSTITGFTGTGDHIDLSFITNTSGLATAVLNTADDMLTVTGDNGSTKLQLDPSGDYSNVEFVATQDSSNNTLVTPEIVCFCRGTRILTASGEVAVENLSVGDLVVTASGRQRPIRWLGHRRLDASRHPDPAAIWPIRIRAGAFGEGKPRRDLYVTRGHSFLFDDVLIQAEKLVNGATIVQQPRDHVEIWHVELDDHDIIIAEGALCESYLDTGNRSNFIGGDVFLDLHPDFRPKHWRETCAPLVFDGSALIRARTAILEAAAQQGHAITRDPDLHIVADGERIEPLWTAKRRAVFWLPAGRARIALRSRRFIPAHCQPLSQDKRTLGVAVARLQIDGADVAIDDCTALSSGWHAFERYDNGDRQRWTNGDAPLPAYARLVEIEIAGRGYYWDEPRRDKNVALLA
jgi:hypothetical protein